ncbi:AMPN Aminopeptidase, partial [Acromyrmex charruanus]
MTFLKLLLKSNLIFFVMTTIVTGKNLEDKQFVNYYLPYNIIALHYEIKLTLPMPFQEHIFYGESNINIIVRHSTQKINLHSVFVDLDRQVTLIHETSKRIYESSTFSCDFDLFICTFNFNDLITIGSYMLKLKYNGTMSNREDADGFITTFYKDESNFKWIYSAGNFQTAVGVQYVFPVVNDLMFKATFKIIVDHPKSCAALSNMPVISRKNIENEPQMMRANFRTTPAMHPYLVTIIAADLDTIYTKKAYIPLLCTGLTAVKRLHFALDVAESTTIYLKDKYFQNDILNDIPQTNYVAIPYYRDDGLPNWGTVFYSQEAISYIEEWNSIQRKTEVSALVARKVANQFLNKIILSSWSDIWINEGISTFLGMHVVDKIFTNLRMMDLFVVRTRCESLHLESITNVPSVVFQIKKPYDIKLFSSFRYNKDYIDNIRKLYSCNISMTMETQQCCCNLCCMGNVPVESISADNLWAAMQTALNESNHKNEFNIKKVMDFWITQNQYPILKMTRNYRDGRTAIWVEMRNMSKRHEWWIPVTYTTETNLNFTITPFVEDWITPEQFFIYLPPINVNDWIIVNLQHLGYYRVMYDMENWLRLANYLNSKKYYKIHVVNRAQIIDDAYYFLIMKQLDFDMFKNLTMYLSQEIDYIAWYPMFNIFRNMLNHSNIFSHPQATSFKEHFRNILDNVLKNIGYLDIIEENEFTKSLRLEAARWACLLKSEDCTNAAISHLIRFYEKPDPILPGWKEWMYRNGMMLANNITWNKVLTADALDNKRLEYLACSENNIIIINYIDQLISGYFTELKHRITVFHSIIARHAKNDLILNYILKNFEKIISEMIVTMELIKLLLILASLKVLIIAKTITSNFLPDEAIPITEETLLKLIHYRINLTIYTNENYINTDFYTGEVKTYIDNERAKGNFIFYGESIMNFYLTNGVNFIELNTKGLKVYYTGRIFFNYENLHLNEEKIYGLFNNKSAFITVDHSFTRGCEYYSYHLLMKFVGTITDNTGGFFKIPYENDIGEKKWIIVAADFQGIGAQRIFPSLDESALRANFTISITHQPNYIALSSAKTNVTRTETLKNNIVVTTYFETTDKISPYQVAIVLSELSNCFDSKWRWRCRRYVQLKDIKYAQDLVENFESYLRTVFKNSKLPRKINYVIIPGFKDEGLESWGLVLYRESLVLYDEKLDIVARKFELARMVAHKMVYQFFGNLISQSKWSYLWLNEGIATFYAMKLLNKVYINPQLMDLLAVQFQHESLRLNDHYDMPLVPKIDTSSDNTTFFPLTHYLNCINSQLRSDNTWNSTIDSFFNVLKKAVNESNDDLNLAVRLYHWTMQERYPILQMTRDKIYRNKVIITLQKDYYNNSYPTNMWIHVTYVTKNSSNYTREEWLSPNMSYLELTIKEDDWIIINVQQAGYYRINYDNDNWRKLARYLNSTEYMNVHVLNRAQIIDDAYFFLLRNKLEYSFFEQLTYYLSNETNYVAWYPMFKILENISGFFPFSKSTRIKEHFQKILVFLLFNIGYVDLKNENDFTKCLRHEAVKWACVLNSQECMAVATSDLMQLYENSKLYQIFPGWKEWTYCKGIMKANNITWNKVLNEEKKPLNNQLLEFLACSKSDTIIIDYINLLKSRYFTNVKQCIIIFHSIIAKHIDNDLVFKYILQNFEKIVPR